MGALDTYCAPILHQNLYYQQTDRSEIPYDTRHLGFPSVASTLMFEHMVRSIQNGFLAYCALGANCAPIMHRNKHCLQTD